MMAVNANICRFTGVSGIPHAKAPAFEFLSNWLYSLEFAIVREKERERWVSFG